MINRVLLLIYIGSAWSQSVTHGPICGGVSDTEAVFILRTDTASIVQIEFSSDSSFNNSLFSDTLNSGNDSDNWAKLHVSGLQPSTRYFYRAVLDNTPGNTQRYFDAFPTPGSVMNFQFLTGSCQQAGGDSNSNSGLIFPIMAQENPAFFIHQGDWGYPDTTDDEQGQPGNYFPLEYSRVQASYRTRFDNVFPVQDLLAVTPVAYLWDDHDLVNENADSTLPGIPNSLLGYQNMFPSYPLPAPSNGGWHLFSYGNCDVFMLDNRAKRAPNLDAFDFLLPDSVLFNPSPEHTILGREQMDWLKQELISSTADWKFISSGTPFNPGLRACIEVAVLAQAFFDTISSPFGVFQPVDIAIEIADKWAGFPADAYELINHVIENNIPNVIFLSGDTHTSGIDDGRSSLFPELMSGPLDRTNSQLVSFMEELGMYIWNMGGHNENQSDYGNAYGRISVAGSDSVILESVTENGAVIGRHVVQNGYLPPSRSAVIGPQRLNFGDVEVNGSPGIQGFLVVNTSIETITIDSINISVDSGYLVIPQSLTTPFDVPSGGKSLIAVLFSPTGADTSNAVISVHTNIGEDVVYEVSVTGVGIDAVSVNNGLQHIEQFTLNQNYPNPFNLITQIHYYLPKRSNVKLTIYDLMGRKIRTLVDKEQQAGFRSVQWNATNDVSEQVTSGIYLYSIMARDFRKTKMMVLLK